MADNFFKNYIYPVATLSASIIGVGFLSLPYITVKVGLLVMLFYFAALTALVLLLHLVFGQICLKTPDFKRWPGFVGFYLGQKAKKFILASVVSGSLGVLLAYLLVGGQFLYEIFSLFWGGSILNYTLIYFIPAGIFIYFGVKAISKFDFLAITFLFLILFLIFIKELPHMNISNLLVNSRNLDFRNLFLPYGPIIFSLWGIGLIPEVEEMVRGKKNSLKKIIASAILLAAGFYFLFILLIVGISGSETSDSALGGLKNFLRQGTYSAALLIGVITTFIAFVAHGLLLKKVLIYDVGIKEFPAWLLTCFVPLALFLLGFNSFIPLIAFVGSVFLGIDGILILLIYKKIGGKKIIAYPLTLIFIFGIVYSIVYFIK